MNHFSCAWTPEGDARLAVARAAVATPKRARRQRAPGSPFGMSVGSSVGDCNLISGNDTGGIGIWYAIATNNRVEGNRIGTYYLGTSAIGNNSGVGIQESVGNVIGGSTPAA